MTLHMKPLITLVFLFASPFVNANALGNADLGKVKSPSCVFCHGQNGQALNPSYPNLNGQNAEYLYQSMVDYQQGKRTNGMAQMMAAQLRQLNEQDLRDIAAFYAQQP